MRSKRFYRRKRSRWLDKKISIIRQKEICNK